MSAKLRLTNPRSPSKEPAEVSALADTGSVFLCIPQHVCLQLGLVVQFKNRTGVMGALVVGNEVLLGAIPMEDMDLVVNPRDRTVDVNPASPNIASGIAKRAA